MNRNVAGYVVAALCAALAAACRDSSAPQVTVVLSQLSRRDSLDISAAQLDLDSVTLTLSGPAATQGRWTVTHGAAPWISIGTKSGTGNSVVRWARDPSNLGFGTWVDTIAITVEGAGGVVRVIDSLVIGGAQPPFITVKRAWRPGERDSVVAFVTRTRAAGEFSFALAQLLGSIDSVSYVAHNPAATAPARAGLRPAPMLGQAGQTWTVIGMQIRELFPIFPGSATMDSLNWLGVFWYASPDSGWIGRVIAGTSASTIGKTTVNTTSFDASGAKSGVGGGEKRDTSTGIYWEANSGQLWVKSNVCSPSSCANATFASGPWRGGQWHGLLVGGQLISILAPCVLPVGCTSVDTFNLNFGTGPVGPIVGIYINCVFPSPCTGAAAAALAELGRRRATLRQSLLGDLFARDERRSTQDR